MSYSLCGQAALFSALLVHCHLSRGYNDTVPKDIRVELHQQPSNAVASGLHHLCAIGTMPEETCDPLVHRQARAQHGLLVRSQYANSNAVLELVQSEVRRCNVCITPCSRVDKLLLVCCPIGGAIGGEREELGGTDGITLSRPNGSGNGMHNFNCRIIRVVGKSNGTSRKHQCPGVPGKVKRWASTLHNAIHQVEEPKNGIVNRRGSAPITLVEAPLLSRNAKDTAWGPELALCRWVSSSTGRRYVEQEEEATHLVEEDGESQNPPPQKGNRQAGGRHPRQG